MRSSSSCSMPAHPPVIDPHCDSHLLPTSFNHTTSWIFNLSFPVSTFPPQHIYKARPYPKKKFLPGSHPVFSFSSLQTLSKRNYSFFLLPSLSFVILSSFPHSTLPPLFLLALFPSHSFPLSLSSTFSHSLPFPVSSSSPPPLSFATLLPTVRGIPPLTSYWNCS